MELAGGLETLLLLECFVDDMLEFDFTSEFLCMAVEGRLGLLRCN